MMVPGIQDSPDYCPNPRDLKQSLAEIKEQHGGQNPYCMDELFIQLGMLVIVQQLVEQLIEVAGPWIKIKVATLKEESAMRSKGQHSSPMSDEEVQAKLLECPGTFDDYNEMVLQFGYVTLFAAAFPLASMCSLLNNWVELKGDARKLLFCTQRPRYMGAEDIGTWQGILNVMIVFAVVTNSCLIGFTSVRSRAHWPLLQTHTWLVIVVAEHAMFAVRFLLSEMVPSIPPHVSRAMAVQEYEKDVALKMLSKMVEHAKSNARDPGTVLGQKMDHHASFAEQGAHQASVEFNVQTATYLA